MTRPDAQTRARIVVMLQQMVRERRADADAAGRLALDANALDAACTRITAWDVPDIDDPEVKTYTEIFGSN